MVGSGGGGMENIKNDFELQFDIEQDLGPSDTVS